MLEKLNATHLCYPAPIAITVCSGLDGQCYLNNEICDFKILFHSYDGECQSISLPMRVNRKTEIEILFSRKAVNIYDFWSVCLRHIARTRRGKQKEKRCAQTRKSLQQVQRCWRPLWSRSCLSHPLIIVQYRELRSKWMLPTTIMHGIGPTACCEGFLNLRDRNPRIYQNSWGNIFE